MPAEPAPLERIEEFEQLHWIEACDLLYRGGFRYGRGLVTMLAIAKPESELGIYRKGPVDFKTMTLKPNADGSVDWSWLMLNDRWHPEVDHQRAYADPLYAAAEAYRISERGDSFGAWWAYRDRKHLTWMPAARFAAALHAVIVLKRPTSEASRIALYP